MNVQKINNIQPIIDGLERQGYLIGKDLATVVFLLLKIRKPVLIEGPPGIGKTELPCVSFKDDHARRSSTLQ
ncbi:MAG: hypothetical protein L6Q97_15990 [Thermoanaerobaculia bacterium]|nr:hypothetical protein [Thermoanaerobaculia bacterium]